MAGPGALVLPAHLAAASHRPGGFGDHRPVTAPERPRSRVSVAATVARTVSRGSSRRSTVRESRLSSIVRHAPKPQPPLHELFDDNARTRPATPRDWAVLRVANDKPFRVEERATSACAPLSATKMAANAKLALEGDRSLQLETVRAGSSTPFQEGLLRSVTPDLTSPTGRAPRMRDVSDAAMHFYATLFAPLDFRTACPDGVFAKVERLSAELTLKQARPRRVRTEGEVKELHGSSKRILSDLFLRYNLRVSLEDGATMYRSSFLRILRDMGAFGTSGDVTDALKAFDATAEVWSGAQVLTRVGFLEAVVRTYGAHAPVSRDDLAERILAGLARCDERCPPVPSEYEEAVKLARRGKTVYEDKVEKEKEKEKARRKTRPARTPDPAASDDEDGGSDAEAKSGVHKTDEQRAREILERLWCFRVLRADARSRIERREMRRAATRRPSYRAEEDRLALGALGREGIHEEVLHEIPSAKAELEKLKKESRQETQKAEAAARTIAQAGGCPFQTMSFQPAITDHDWWGRRWWAKLRVDDFLGEPDLIMGLLEYEAPLAKIFDTYARGRDLEPGLPTTQGHLGVKHAPTDTPPIADADTEVGLEDERSVRGSDAGRSTLSGSSLRRKTNRNPSEGPPTPKGKPTTPKGFSRFKKAVATVVEEVRKTREIKDGDPPPKFASMILPATELERISLMPRSKTQVDRDRRATLLKRAATRDEELEAELEQLEKVEETLKFMTLGDWHLFVRDFAVAGSALQSVVTCRDICFVDIICRTNATTIGFDGFVEGIARLAANACVIHGNAVQQRMPAQMVAAWALCWLRQRSDVLLPEMPPWEPRPVASRFEVRLPELAFAGEM